MNQTIALFYDAYRELNSKRMFWISLILSGIVVLAFVAIGVSSDGHLSLLGFRTPLPLPLGKAEFYKIVFSNLGIGLWLTFIGAILAIISTAGIFPDLITGGAIDLYLSKPIGRLRLFLTKYAAGLLFVALQVTVFCIASFLVIGVRGGLWEPRIFLGIPLVLCFFSYLFSVSVLFGLLTRSTIAAVLLTMLFWFVVWGLDRAEIISLLGQIHGQQQVEDYDTLIKQQRGSYNFLRDKLAATQPTTRETRMLEEHREQMQSSIDEREKLTSSAHGIDVAHRIVYNVKSFLPKTRETNELLDRYMLSTEEMADYDTRRSPGGGLRKPRLAKPKSKSEGPAWTDPETVKEAQAEMHSRPIWWVIGTSLLFEGVVLSLAAWVFFRRDY